MNEKKFTRRVENDQGNEVKVNKNEHRKIIEGQEEENRKKYKNTFDFFDSFMDQFDRQLVLAREAGDIDAIEGLEGAQEETRQILDSLESGDVEPAFNKIKSMALKSTENLELGAGGHIAMEPKEHVDRTLDIMNLINYLKELEGENKTQNIATEKKELE